MEPVEGILVAPPGLEPGLSALKGLFIALYQISTMHYDAAIRIVFIGHFFLASSCSPLQQIAVIGTNEPRVSPDAL
ncbi:MAG TPA: hypothetical protein VIX90_15460 [Edaphobacter sp.]